MFKWRNSAPEKPGDKSSHPFLSAIKTMMSSPSQNGKTQSDPAHVEGETGPEVVVSIKEPKDKKSQKKEHNAAQKERSAVQKEPNGVHKGQNEAHKEQNLSSQGRGYAQKGEPAEMSDADPAVLRKRKVTQAHTQEPTFLASSPRSPSKRTKGAQVIIVSPETPKKPTPTAAPAAVAARAPIPQERKATRSSDRLKKRSLEGEDKPLFSPHFVLFGKPRKGRQPKAPVDQDDSSSESLLPSLSTSQSSIATTPRRTGSPVKRAESESEMMEESAENLLKEDSSVTDSLSKALQSTMEVDDQMISREETEEIPGGFVQTIIPLVNLPALVTHQMAQSEEEEELEDTTDFDPYYFIKSLPPLTPDMLVQVDHFPDKIVGHPHLTLVLDLDETLVHCTTTPIPNPDLTFSVEFNGEQFQVFALKRPFLEEFLHQVSQHFEVIIFTASQQIYADTLLNLIDQERRWIQHRLFRETCLYVEGNYLKELSVIKRDLSKTIIVDNSPQAFGYQVDNGIPITSWYDDKNDRELLDLLEFLKTLTEADDIRPFLRDKYQLAKKIESLVVPV